jgi:hypothetical protein
MAICVDSRFPLSIQLIEMRNPEGQPLGMIPLFANRFNEARPQVLQNASAKAGKVEGHGDMLAVRGVDCNDCTWGSRGRCLVFLPDNETRGA